MASQDDVRAAYATWPDKGVPDGSGRRVTVLTLPGEAIAGGTPIDIYHVFEATLPGVDVFVMGPKPVYGESVDGSQVTPTGPAGEELAPALYDGEVLPGPAVDVNYAVTIYTFSSGSGSHTVTWDPVSGLNSNTLVIVV